MPDAGLNSNIRKISEPRRCGVRTPSAQRRQNIATKVGPRQRTGLTCLGDHNGRQPPADTCHQFPRHVVGGRVLPGERADRKRRSRLPHNGHVADGGVRLRAVLRPIRRRTDTPDQPEPGGVQPARQRVWWQRVDHHGPSRPARPRDRRLGLVRERFCRSAGLGHHRRVQPGRASGERRRGRIDEQHAAVAGAELPDPRQRYRRRHGPNAGRRHRAVCRLLQRAHPQWLFEGRRRPAEPRRVPRPLCGDRHHLQPARRYRRDDLPAAGLGRPQCRGHFGRVRTREDGRHGRPRRTRSTAGRDGRHGGTARQSRSGRRDALHHLRQWGRGAGRDRDHRRRYHPRRLGRVRRQYSRCWRV